MHGFHEKMSRLELSKNEVGQKDGAVWFLELQHKESYSQVTVMTEGLRCNYSGSVQTSSGASSPSVAKLERTLKNVKGRETRQTARLMRTRCPMRT